MPLFVALAVGLALPPLAFAEGPVLPLRRQPALRLALSTPLLDETPPSYVPQAPPTAPATDWEESAEERLESAAQSNESVTNKGWFWAAVAGVVITSVAILILTNQPARAPASSLGDMEAFKGR